jgi:V8-like Glu-specific endopeptidase
MRLGRFRLLASILSGIIAIAGVCIGFVVSSGPGQAAQSQPNIRTAAAGSASTVGALFLRSTSGQLTTHFCTGSVVDSPGGDLVVTAAHCLIGRTASQVVFIPEYAHGQRPFGVWLATQVIEDPEWKSFSDPDDDFAFLIVHRRGTGTRLETLTGGESLGVGAPAGGTVQVAGYPDKLDGPITCQNATRDYSATQFEFDCGGFTNGTSGSPLLAPAGPLGETVIGVIGGYEQGGYTPSVSYAAKFSTRMETLYRAALAIAHG